MLAREGSAIPVNLAEQHFGRRADQRGFCVFPHAGAGAFSAESFEDDGEGVDGPRGRWRLSVETDAAEVRLTVSRDGDFAGDGALRLILPRTERRTITVTGPAVFQVG